MYGDVLFGRHVILVDDLDCILYRGDGSSAYMASTWRIEHDGCQPEASSPRDLIKRFH